MRVGCKMNTVVELEFYEIQTAALNGVSRCIETFRHKQNWGHGYKKDMLHQFSDSIQGSLAEQGAAKYFQTYYSSHVNTFSQPDLMVGDKKIQIRCQKKKDKNYLIVRPNAKPDEYYVLVINECPKMTIAGWVLASDILGNEKYLTDFGIKDRPPVYGVPMSDLTSMDKFNEAKLL